MHEYTYRHCPACGAPLELRPLRRNEPARPVCAACGFVHYANPKVAVGTILEANDSTLVGVGRSPTLGAPRARPARTEWGSRGPAPRQAQGALSESKSASERVGGSAGAKPPGSLLVLVRRAIEPGYGRWVFPGGFVDRGEPLEAAAVREAREETGLDVHLDALVNVYSYAGAPVVVVVYAATAVGGRLTIDEESLEAALFPPARLPWTELAFDSTHDALRDYLAGLRHPLHAPASKS